MKFPVREGADEELDAKRRKMFGAELDRDMRDCARVEMERLPAQVTDGSWFHAINSVP